MDLSTDISTMISLSASFSGGLPTSVTLPNGITVQASVGTASVDQSLINENIIAGLTRTLTIANSTGVSVKAQSNLTWNGQLWGVTQTSLAGNGAATICYLGSAF